MFTSFLDFRSQPTTLWVGANSPRKGRLKLEIGVNEGKSERSAAAALESESEEGVCGKSNLQAADEDTRRPEAS